MKQVSPIYSFALPGTMTNLDTPPPRAYTDAASRGPLAQLARAPARHAGGHWFKSSTAHENGPLRRAIFIEQLSRRAVEKRLTPCQRLDAHRRLGCSTAVHCSTISCSILCECFPLPCASLAPPVAVIINPADKFRLSWHLCFCSLLHLNYSN